MCLQNLSKSKKCLHSIIQVSHPHILHTGKFQDKYKKGYAEGKEKNKRGKNSCTAQSRKDHLSALNHEKYPFKEIQHIQIGENKNMVSSHI